MTSLLCVPAYACHWTKQKHMHFPRSPRGINMGSLLSRKVQKKEEEEENPGKIKACQRKIQCRKAVKMSSLNYKVIMADRTVTFLVYLSLCTCDILANIYIKSDRNVVRPLIKRQKNLNLNHDITINIEY